VELDDRYARHRLIEGWDQDCLRAARVMVAGAGAIGNEVIKLLALLGIGHILIVDFDTVELSNLTRSPLFRETDIGLSKARVAAERAMEMNPDVTVRALCGDLRYEIGLGVYRSLDVVIGCLDSLDARLALNRACWKTRTPWLNGGIEVTVAEVSLFQTGDGACFECSMSPEMWDRRSRRYSCGGLRSVAPESKMPTTAVMASIAAAYLVQEALFLLHSVGSPEKEGLHYSEKITVNIKPYDTAVYSLPRNAECIAHEVFEPVETRVETPAQASVRDLLNWAGAPDGVVELGFDLLLEMNCCACGAGEAIRRPLEQCGDSLVRCPGCGRETRWPETLNWLGAEDPLSRLPLAELGVPDYAILSVRDGELRRYIQIGGRSIWDESSEGDASCT